MPQMVIKKLWSRQHYAAGPGMARGQVGWAGGRTASMR